MKFLPSLLVLIHALAILSTARRSVSKLSVVQGSLRAATAVINSKNTSKAARSAAIVERRHKHTDSVKSFVKALRRVMARNKGKANATIHTNRSKANRTAQTAAALRKANSTVNTVTASNSSRHGSGCGGGELNHDNMPDQYGTPGEYCAFCRYCCDCNANSLDDCEYSTVSVDEYGGDNTGAVVFCDTCESSCSSCPAFDDPALCPGGDCCNDDMTHHPPFDATYG
eukprot:gnl/TRDRNA2_/TRDRNA2_91741_c0_seq7.p2 gnl/TRDRNA2_/TRDRNA2_91741_c0~~gnl/TRDRNA2_/TRDRNA2_91741_c0_seq7.p2  ORF type:complete len:227 (+),score=32.08 gnl/TRDRNA2_/TRDRNA2_91741_c0_seq7:77-757(+)